MGMALIILGGLFNITERLATHCVRDYFNFFNLFFYNVFDIAVVVGVCIVGIVVLKTKDAKNSI